MPPIVEGLLRMACNGSQQEDVEFFWKALSDKYTTDDEEANAEFKKELAECGRGLDSLIFRMSCIYEFYCIDDLEFIKDLHFPKLRAVAREKCFLNWWFKWDAIRDVLVKNVSILKGKK